MSAPASAKAPSSLLATRRLVEDLFAHRAGVYWLDLLASATLGWATLLGAALRPLGPLTAVLGAVAVFAWLRAILFIHEISHFRRGVLPGFTAVWNLVVGIPMLVPSFMYRGTHADHHKRNLFATARDPEYLPLAHQSPLRLVRFVAEMLLVPGLLVIRYGILTPLSWLVPPLRRVVVERMSALVINPAYVRSAPEGAERTLWLALELATLAWIAAVAGLALTGTIPVYAVFVWYAVSAGVALVNQVRTLAAHRYDNEGGELTYEEQLLDSVNVRGVPLLTDLVFPVGLKYHALHHHLPDLPYHALPEAHARLMRDLPEGAPYRKTEYPGHVALLIDLWRRCRASAASTGLAERKAT